MARKERVIDAMRDLERLVPAIVKEINADQELALRAAANPLLALEELGYALAPELRAEAERRVRFPQAALERLNGLVDQISRLAGERVDLGSPPELERILFEKLKLPRVDLSQAPRYEPKGPAPPAAQAALRTPPRGAPAQADPLEGLHGAHEIIAPLLEYRRLDASRPRLASRALYEQIKRGAKSLPATQIRARLKRGPTPE